MASWKRSTWTEAAKGDAQISSPTSSWRWSRGWTASRGIAGKSHCFPGASTCCEKEGWPTSQTPWQQGCWLWRQPHDRGGPRQNTWKSMAPTKKGRCRPTFCCRPRSTSARWRRQEEKEAGLEDMEGAGQAGWPSPPQKEKERVWKEKGRKAKARQKAKVRWRESRMQRTSPKRARRDHGGKGMSSGRSLSCGGLWGAILWRWRWSIWHNVSWSRRGHYDFEGYWSNT